MYYANHYRYSATGDTSWVESWAFDTKTLRDAACAAKPGLYPVLKKDTNNPKKAKIIDKGTHISIVPADGEI